MIHFNFSVNSPYGKCIEEHRIFFKVMPIGENKNIEVQYSKMGNTLFGFNFSFSLTGHHAGLNISFSFLRYYFGINYYDSRHWDYEKNCWKEYVKK